MKPAKATPPTQITTTSQPTAPPGELQEQIRVRAYQLYEQRGRDDGHDLDDWLQAEGELSEIQKAA